MSDDDRNMKVARFHENWECTLVYSKILNRNPKKIVHILAMGSSQSTESHSRRRPDTSSGFLGRDSMTRVT